MRNIYDTRVLVVEDDPTLRDLLADLLSGEGYRFVRCAGTVADALSAARTWQPQAYLLDVMLPDGNGFDLLRQVRALGNAPGAVPFRPR